MTNNDPDHTPVARDLFTYCTKEKTDTWHVVVAHNSKGIVERVKCKSCGSDHKYRVEKKAGPSKAVKELKVRKPAAGTGSAARNLLLAESSKQVEETWYGGVKAWGEKPVRTFDPAIHFEKGDVFEHEVFGKGVVQLRRESRIDVLFRVGMKTLPSKL